MEKLDLATHTREILKANPETVGPLVDRLLMEATSRISGSENFCVEEGAVDRDNLPLPETPALTAIALLKVFLGWATNLWVDSIHPLIRRICDQLKFADIERSANASELLLLRFYFWLVCKTKREIAKDGGKEEQAFIKAWDYDEVESGLRDPKTGVPREPEHLDINATKNLLIWLVDSGMQDRLVYKGHSVAFLIAALYYIMSKHGEDNGMQSMYRDTLKRFIRTAVRRGLEFSPYEWMALITHCETGKEGWDIDEDIRLLLLNPNIPDAARSFRFHQVKRWQLRSDDDIVTNSVRKALLEI